MRHEQEHIYVSTNPLCEIVIVAKFTNFIKQGRDETKEIETGPFRKFLNNL